MFNINKWLRSNWRFILDLYLPEEAQNTFKKNEYRS